MHLYFSIILLVVFGSGSNHPPVKADNNAPPILFKINDLDAKYYLKSHKPFLLIQQTKSDTISELINGYDEAGVKGKAARLTLLHSLVYDSSFNSLAWKALNSDSPFLKLQAIQYLAGHPDATDSKQIKWQSEIFESQDHRKLEAWLKGVRRPAPKHQIKLILEHIDSINHPLDALAISTIKKGWRSDASAGLNSIIMGIRDGRIHSRHLLATMRDLADTATDSAMESILFCMNSTSADLNNESTKALHNVISYLHRKEQYTDIVELYRRLYIAFPSQPEYALDYGSAQIQYEDNPDKGIAFFEKLKHRYSPGRDTTKRIIRMEISLGLALADFYKGEDWEMHLADMRSDQAVKDISNPEKRTLAKHDLLKGGFAYLAGGNGHSFFQSALETMPYDPDYVEVDNLFSGRFSLTSLIWRLNKTGREEGAKRIFEGLVNALRTDHSGCGYYPDTEVNPHLSDRIRSRIPLNEAHSLSYYYGRPDLALKKLITFIKSIQDSTYFSNMDLLSSAYYFQGLVEMDLKQPEAAVISIEKGIKIYTQILEDLKTMWLSRAVKSASRYYSREKARGHLYLESINNFVEGDGVKTTRLIREAMKSAPDFYEIILHTGLDRARNGDRKTALDLLANMEIYPDRYYNIACLHSLTGNPDEGLVWLKRHFAEYVPTRRRPVELRYARKDPDLKNVRSLPGFSDLIN